MKIIGLILGSLDTPSIDTTRKNGKEHGKAIRNPQVVTAAPHRPVVGEAAPEIVLTDSEGNMWRSNDHLGQTVVVIFHRHIH